MIDDTHQRAPTPFVEAAGIRFAYRRLGAKIDVSLLLFMQSRLLGWQDLKPIGEPGEVEDVETVLSGLSYGRRPLIHEN
jgi:hypothetical protein